METKQQRALNKLVTQLKSVKDSFETEDVSKLESGNLKIIKDQLSTMQRICLLIEDREEKVNFKDIKKSFRPIENFDSLENLRFNIDTLFAKIPKDKEERIEEQEQEKERNPQGLIKNVQKTHEEAEFLKSLNKAREEKRKDKVKSEEPAKPTQKFPLPKEVKEHLTEFGGTVEQQAPSSKEERAAFRIIFRNIKEEVLTKQSKVEKSNKDEWKAAYEQFANFIMSSFDKEDSLENLANTGKEHIRKLYELAKKDVPPRTIEKIDNYVKNQKV